MYHHTHKRPYLHHYMTFYYEYMPKVDRTKKKTGAFIDDLHKKMRNSVKGKK